MAQHGHDQAHYDDNGHDRGDGHGHDHGHARDHAAEERMNHEILADREWMFDAFIRFSAWNVVLIFAILALLALTQT